MNETTDDEGDTMDSSSWERSMLAAVRYPEHATVEVKYGVR